MNWSNRLSWWSLLTAKRTKRRSGDADHGDMGTAFGLDASFGPLERDDAPQTDASSAPAPTPGALPWEHRLTRRSSL